MRSSSPVNFDIATTLANIALLADSRTDSDRAVSLRLTMASAALASLSVSRPTDWRVSHRPWHGRAMPPRHRHCAGTPQCLRCSVRWELTVPEVCPARRSTTREKIAQSGSKMAVFSNALTANWGCSEIIQSLVS